VLQSSDSSLSVAIDASGRDALTVGRIGSGRQNKTEFSLWTVADTLQFGFAGALVGIIEVLVKAFL
jgi:aspartate-semialdehyde dehydrogenase